LALAYPHNVAQADRNSTAEVIIDEKTRAGRLGRPDGGTVAGRNLGAVRYCLPGALAGMTVEGRGDEVAPPKTTLVQVLPPPVDGVNEREISMGANLINNNNNNNNKKKKIAYYTFIHVLQAQ